jgi:hypothetical protein
VESGAVESGVSVEKGWLQQSGIEAGFRISAWEFSVVSNCPSTETLGRLGADLLEDGRLHEVEEHVESCGDCQSVLERLAREDRDAGESRAALVPDVEEPPAIAGFTIEAELGRGGMGVVYRAWQPLLQRRVALKVVPSGPATGAKLRERWLREARSVTRVRDPGVVQLHDVGEAGGWLYLVLEYVPGGSLKDRLKGPLPGQHAARLVEQIAGAVGSVHRAGLLHLDLKPSNILLDSQPDAPWERSAPKVADFGIARIGDEPGACQTTLRGPWGTPSYMAPEQVDGDGTSVGPASDVYALGAILYELLTGRPPFQAASLVETLNQVREQDPAPPRRLNPNIPRDLETICSVCLQKDPKRRYASVDALADDLRRWRGGQAISARPESGIQHMWRLARRHPMTAALSAALCMTLLTALLGLATLWRRSVFERRQAEASRDIAQANFDVASRSLRGLSDFVFETTSSPGDITIPRVVDSFLERALAEQRALARRYPRDPTSQEQLAILAYQLASVYNVRGRFADARSLYEEAINLWARRIEQGTDPVQARAHQRSALLGLGNMSATWDDLSAVDRWNDQALAIADTLIRTPGHVGEVCGLTAVKRNIADHLAIRGAGDHAKRLLESDLRLVDSLPAELAGQLEPTLCRVLALAALGKTNDDVWHRIGLPDSARQTSGPCRVMLIQALSEYTARDSGLRALGTTSPDRDDGRMAPEDWADRAVRSLEKRCAALGLDRACVPTIGRAMCGPVAGTASDQRNARQLPAAQRTATLMKAFARRLAEHFPEHPGPLLILCEGYLQDAKNAWRTGDRATIRRCVQSSLEAAKRASALDPGSEEVRGFYVDRRRRLAEFDADQKRQ